MTKLLNLKFKGGVVTEMVDLKKTFGEMYYLGSEPVLHYDEETQESTGEIVGYDVVIISENTKKPYKIKFDRTDLDFTKLKTRDVIELIQPVIRFYHDGGNLTQGSTISMSAENFRKVEMKNEPEPFKKEEKPKQK